MSARWATELSGLIRLSHYPDIECPPPPPIPTHADYRLEEDDGSVVARSTPWPEADTVTQAVLYNSTTQPGTLPRNFNTSLT